MAPMLDWKNDAEFIYYNSPPHRFKPLDRDHWLCRLFGRHVRYTIIGQTCSEPEWTAQCEVCDRHGDFFIPNMADKARFDTRGKPRCFKGWFL